jgi:hypothetical protein
VGIARAAKSQVRPLTKSDLQQARAELVAAAERLDQRLGRDGAKGKQWRDYMHLDQFKDQLRQPNELDAQSLVKIYAKFNSGYNGLELVWFADVREALRHYLEVASGVDNPGVKAAYEQRLDGLADQLQKYLSQPTPELATDISESVAWLASAGQAPALVEAIRTRFGQPNFYGQVGGAVVGAGVAGPVDETEPIQDCILGTAVQGIGRTLGQTTVSLVPDPCNGAFDTFLEGTNHSNNVGRNGPVCIYSRGETKICATKRIWINADGRHAYPAVTSARNRAIIYDIEAQRQIIERIGWRRSEKQLPEAQAIASRHAEQRVNYRVDQQAAPAIEQANSNYATKVRIPLTDRKAFPRQVCFSTTPSFIQMLGLQAGPNQLAAASVPPPLTETVDIGVRTHETMINNMANTVLANMVMREEMLQETVKSLLGYVPEQMKADAAKDQEPWTIVFPRRDPISVTFKDGGFQATLRGREFHKGDNKYPGMNVTAVYKFVKTDQGIKLVRQGELQIFPPGFVPGGGQRLSARHQAIRTLLQERLGKMLSPEIVPKGFTLSGKAAAAGKFMPVEMNARDGWLVLGWRR